MLNVLKSGFFTSVQDAGRFNYRHKGVPVSGSMDTVATSKVNALLENDSDAALLEITMTGPTLEFEKDTYIVLGGADMNATLNNSPISNYCVYKINQGDILSYGKLSHGFRAYLGVKFGFKTEPILGSRSQYVPITANACIKDKDQLLYDPCPQFEPKIQALKLAEITDQKLLNVSKGPEFEILSDRDLEILFSKSFTVAKENNRMAYQLKETISEHSFTMLTSATLPGTVQLTPSGKLIILMKDGQTTGGYPRIIQLSANSIATLAQQKSGEILRFKLI